MILTNSWEQLVLQTSSVNSSSKNLKKKNCTGVLEKIYVMLILSEFDSRKILLVIIY